jgi:hypothetical protein
MARQYFGYGRKKDGSWVDAYVGASLSAATTAVQSGLNAGSFTTGKIASSHWPVPKIVARNLSGS